MWRAVIGIGQDDEGHWMARLECGHGVHDGRRVDRLGCGGEGRWAVGAAEAPDSLQGVGEEVTQEWREGGVVVDFDERVLAHGRDVEVQVPD